MYIGITQIGEILKIDFNVYANYAPAKTTYLNKYSIQRITINVNESIEVSFTGEQKTWVFCHYLNSTSPNPKIQQWGGEDLVDFAALEENLKNWMDGI